MTDKEPTPTPASDGLAFDDPAAWGYCPRCAFQVAAFEGQLKLHSHSAGDYTSRVCPGSGEPSGVQPGPDVKPDEVKQPVPSRATFADLAQTVAAAATVISRAARAAEEESDDDDED